MENDDKPVGQLLSRRDALRLLGIGGAAFLAPYAAPEATGPRLREDASLDSSVPGCLVRPELTIGSHFVDDQLNRSDIRYDPREDKISKGTPLTLNIHVFDVSRKSCAPLEGARVDVWHCDAMGIYSGISDGVFNSLGQRFLRGYQQTDAKGRVQFQTIYPGWYSGRTVHIHFTIRTKGADRQDYQFTSQLFFRDALTDQVHSKDPYAKKGKRNTRNPDDQIFKNGGNQLLLNVRGDGADGYIAAINLGIDLTDANAGAPDFLTRPGPERKPPQ
jgi:protocatechuate 3,4-dioxygenase beta subunit